MSPLVVIKMWTVQSKLPKQLQEEIIFIILIQSPWTGLFPIYSYIIGLPEQHLRSQTLQDGENSCSDSHKGLVTTEIVLAVFP